MTTDLASFRAAVRSARRLVGRTQQQLARSIGLHPDVLSHKLNNRDNAVLTRRDVLGIIARLVEWGAITHRTEAHALLELMAVPTHGVTAQPWYAKLSDPSPGVLLSSSKSPGSGDMRASSAAAPSSEPDPTSSLPSVLPPPPPQPITPLIGRGAEVAAVQAALRTSRFVTLTGIGGTGKTRVALAAAASLSDEFADGVAFADLSPLTDPTMIGAALVQALGMPIPPLNTSPEETELKLRHALRPARLLLVVDNVEHVIDGSCVLTRLLAWAPHLRILATSRRVLRLYGEHQLRIPPLRLPADTAAAPTAVRDTEAVQLFLARARAVHPGFDPQGPALDAVASICTALDGLPLAIELAAAHARMFSAQAILDRLDDQMTFLCGGSRDVSDRQRSLRGSLAWSDDLLGDAERRLFLRLAYLAGCFDAATAAALLRGKSAETGDAIANLAEHSLLEVSVTEPTAHPRFRMLESVRQYAFACRAEAEGTGSHAHDLRLTA